MGGDGGDGGGGDGGGGDGGGEGMAALALRMSVSSGVNAMPLFR